MVLFCKSFFFFELKDTSAKRSFDVELGNVGLSKDSVVTWSFEDVVPLVKGLSCSLAERRNTKKSGSLTNLSMG